MPTKERLQRLQQALIQAALDQPSPTPELKKALLDLLSAQSSPLNVKET